MKFAYVVGVLYFSHHVSLYPHWWKFPERVYNSEIVLFHAERGGKVNLVPRAHVPFGQHQDTKLWNNQFPETKILGLPASQRMRGLV